MATTTGSTFTRQRGLGARRSLALLALLAATLLWALHGSGAAQAFAGTALQVPFDERIGGYSLEQTQAVFAQLSPPQWQAYQRYRLLDLPLPWVLAALAAGLLQRWGAGRLALLAWLTALIDSGENALLWLLMAEPGAIDAQCVQLASLLTQAKWVAYGFSLGTLALVALFTQGLRRTARQPLP